MGRVVTTLSDLADALPTPASRTRSASTPPPRRRTLLQQGRGRRSGIWRGWGAAGAIERSSFDDEQPLGNPGPRRRRWFELPHCVPQSAADPGLDAHSAAEDNLHSFIQEDERVGHVPCNCKYCLMSSPVLVGRKKNHVQVDGNHKRVARAAEKNDNKEPAPPEEILEALREIPRLEHAGLLRAYSTFIRDDRLFRSLMALPEDMRKDWLLMEIGNQ